jgi:hypothetical protein
MQYPDLSGPSADFDDPNESGGKTVSATKSKTKKRKKTVVLFG